MSEPLRDLVSEQSVHGILGRAELVDEAVCAEDWNPNGVAIDSPTFPGDPDVEIQEAGCVRQGSDHLTLHGNRMGGDFLVEGFAERDRVVGCDWSRRFRFSAAIEPKTHGVHEVEASRIDDGVLTGLLFCAEEDRAAKIR